jgi:hypothetical protein
LITEQLQKKGHGKNLSYLTFDGNRTIKEKAGLCPSPSQCSIAVVSDAILEVQRQLLGDLRIGYEIYGHHIELYLFQLESESRLLISAMLFCGYDSRQRVFSLVLYAACIFDGV